MSSIISVTEFQSAVNYGSTNITVPDGCDCMVLFVSGYQGTQDYFSSGSPTFDGTTLDVAQGSADNSMTAHMGCSFIRLNPGTGSKAFSWDWFQTPDPTDGVIFTFVFLSGVAQVSPIRDSEGLQRAAGSPITSKTLTAQSGDLILAWAEKYSSATSTFTWTDATKYADYDLTPYRTSSGSIATAAPSGNQTVGIAWTPSGDDGSLTTLVLKPGVSSVSKTLQANYSVAGHVSKTLVASYNILGNWQDSFPTSDVAAGGWSPTPLYSRLSDVGNTISAIAGGSMFPLQVSADGRYLETGQGNPFLIRGDSPQALFVNCSLTTVEAYLDDRLANGFNAIWVNLLCATNTFGLAHGETYDAIQPFNIGDRPLNYDITTPNSTYFARMDAMLALFEERDMVCFLNPCETIDWLVMLLNNGVPYCQQYGEWLGTRYADNKHIIWFHGNDFQSWNESSPADPNRVAEVAAGIKTNAPDHLHTILLDFEISWSSEFDHWASPLTGPDLQAVYTYHNAGWSCTQGRVLVDADPIPAFLAETNYEYEANTGDAYTLRRQRIQEWSAFASGMCGHLYGNHYTSVFIGDWGTYSAECHNESLTQYMLANDFMEAREWWKLAPDVTHTVLTAGYGTYAEGTSVSAGDFAPCAKTTDNRFAIIYSPSGANRTLTVDMSEFSGTVTARWLDPSDGTLTADGASPLANSGSHDFHTPSGTNSDGDNDWVLVLEVL